MIFFWGGSYVMNSEDVYFALELQPSFSVCVYIILPRFGR